ncbi:hypothetical protein TTHERM_00926960 (macronuclear) [Tetrahymena thermophila SB210]|uniref:Transmembrane protein n=1 Tax=Tetrahymena thermophila (strain SB210) TaxID=312017 RepID=Q22DW3_TETTS|nr:hypothetical protein TTHERM_00926960 [Tetrahymena thermophila SB210]EAR83442.1 hypothetical protein TTHERM_00926960 [Tetrahymena thermophila SB210]|eukprot:XP_001031105.1 hypothetical protein TTHERM_00926960 [Tetrahymena thermophila SB210]
MRQPEELSKYTQNPRQSIAQKTQEFVKDNWVVVGLIVAIISVGLYAVVNDKTSKSDFVPAAIDKRYMLNETSIFPDYRTIVTTGLEKNFEGVNRDVFQPKIHEITLNATKWKDLFEKTQEMIKGMKLIKIQEEDLTSKHSHFNKTEENYKECREILLSKDLDVSDDTIRMQEANTTIAHAEGILEGYRDELHQLQTRRKEELNELSISINHRLYEKDQMKQKISQSADKDEIIQDLQAKLEQIQQNIKTKKLEIVRLKELQKADLENSNSLDNSINHLSESVQKLKFEIASLEVNLEIDQIAGRINRQEHINNTKQMIQTIQKRIKLFNNHKISSDDTKELEKQLEQDKQKLKDLNALQINLIKSFYQKTVSASGKTLEELKQEEKSQNEKLQTLKKKYENRDESFNKYEKQIDAIEQEVRQLQEDETKAKQNLENALMNSSGGSDKQVDAELTKRRIKELEEDILKLKENKNNLEVEFQEKIDKTMNKISEQKTIISEIYIKFTTYVKDRKNIEEKILTDLNRCRLHRYMMEVIQKGANEEHENIATTLKNLKNIKYAIFELLEEMVPEEDDDENQESTEQNNQQEQISTNQ